MVLRQHGARDVDLAAADMGVQVDRTGHDDHAGHVDFLVDPGRRPRVGDDAAVLHKDVAHFLAHAVSRIDDGSAFELEQHRRHPSAARIASSAAAVAGSGESRSLRSGSATTLSAR